jgi:putative endonuclease
MNKRAVGAAHEKQVGDYLTGMGYQILAYNFRCHSGEIDIVARDGAYLVFVEVKYRGSAKSGDPLEAVTDRKQRTICRTASFYCLRYGYGDSTPCRFDVAAVRGDEITVIQNAFEYHI